MLVSNNKKSPTQRGFTLIELLVSITIVAVILALVMVNFKSFEKNIILSNDSEKLSSILRQAQIWALTGQTIGNNRYSYGVSIDLCNSPPCDIILFADQDSDNEYDSGPPDEAVSGGNFQLSDFVYIDSIQLDGVDVASPPLDIIFEPPTAKIYFEDDDALYDLAEIQITHKDTGASNTISINRQSGQIDIQ